MMFQYKHIINCFINTYPPKNHAEREKAMHQVIWEPIKAHVCSSEKKWNGYIAIYSNKTGGNFFLNIINRTVLTDLDTLQKTICRSLDTPTVISYFTSINILDTNVIVLSYSPFFGGALQLKFLHDS